MDPTLRDELTKRLNKLNFASCLTCGMLRHHFLHGHAHLWIKKLGTIPLNKKVGGGA